jgi:hypothetical protein
VVSGAEWSRAVVLTDEEFLACWDAMALGAVPLDLELSFPATPAEAETEYTAALEQLSRRGLAGSEGPGPALAESLRVLAEAPIALDLRLSDGLVVLGAIDGEQGVVLVVDAEHEPGLYLLPVAGTRVAATLVRLAGPLEPDDIEAVTLPSDVLDAARREVPGLAFWTFAGRLVARGVPESDAHTLALMLTGITSGGQLGATARVDGAQVPSSWVLAFHRCAAGAVMQLRQPLSRGRDRVTFAPICPEGLLARLRELVAALETGAPDGSSRIAPRAAMS